MLIPILDLDPYKVPARLPDEHVIKLINECFQVVCTVLPNLLDNVDHLPLVKSTHKNHPYTLWAGKSPIHMHYTLHLVFALCKHKKERWPGNKPHVYEEKARQLYSLLPPFLCSPALPYILELTQVPPVCVGSLPRPDQDRVSAIQKIDPVAGFILYYKLSKRTNPSLWHFCGGQLKTLGCHKRVGKAKQGKVSVRCRVTEPIFWSEMSFHSTAL